MRTALTPWALVACLAALGLAGASHAAEDKGPAPLERPDLDRRVHGLLVEIINDGADLYNGGDPSACYHEFRGGLKALRPLLDHRPDLQKAIDDGLATAPREPTAEGRAWALRHALDRVWNGVGGANNVARVPEAPPPPPPLPVSGTLWERIGGEENVTKVANDFVEAALIDPKVNLTRGDQYFKNPAEVAHFKRALVEMASSVSGGPLTYKGKSMAELHPPGMNITNAEFDAFVADMKGALEKNRVRPAEVALILTAVEAMRPKIVPAPIVVGKTLWDRLGKETGITKIAGEFVDKVLADKTVNLTRDGKYFKKPGAIADFKRSLVVLASTLGGGDLPRYTGKSMAELHPADMAITDAEFDAFVADMKAVLKENQVQPEDVALILKALESTRSNIVHVRKATVPAGPVRNGPIAMKGAPETDRAHPADLRGEDKVISPAVLRSSPASFQLAAAPLLPNDTEAVITINVKQILASPLVKDNALEKLKDALKNQGEVQDVLTDLGLDPFTDVDTVTFASSHGSDTDKGLIIVRGTFDVDRFQKWAEDAVRDQKHDLKVHTDAQRQLKYYEIALPNQERPVFVKLANKNTLLASPMSAYLLDALDKEAGRKKTTLKHEELQALLNRIDPKQSLWVAVLGTALENSELAKKDETKELIEKVQDVSGGVTIDKNVKVQLDVTAKTTKDAEELDDKIKDGLNQALGLVAILAGNKRELAPLVDVLRNVKPARNDRTITLEAEFAGENIRQLIPRD